MNRSNTYSPAVGIYIDNIDNSKLSIGKRIDMNYNNITNAGSLYLKRESGIDTSLAFMNTLSSETNLSHYSLTYRNGQASLGY